MDPKGLKILLAADLAQLNRIERKLAIRRERISKLEADIAILEAERAELAKRWPELAHA